MSPPFARITFTGYLLGSPTPKRCLIRCLWPEHPSYIDAPAQGSCLVCQTAYAGDQANSYRDPSRSLQQHHNSSLLVDPKTREALQPPKPPGVTVYVMPLPSSVSFWPMRSTVHDAQGRRRHLWMPRSGYQGSGPRVLSGSVRIGPKPSSSSWVSVLHAPAIADLLLKALRFGFVFAVLNLSSNSRA